MRNGILARCARTLVGIGILLAVWDWQPAQAQDFADSPSRIWASSEYLLFWSKQAPLPVPLVTLGDPVGLGALRQPGTRVLAGGNDIGVGGASGGRFTLGAWLDDEQQFGVEGNYLFLGRRSTELTFGSNAQGQPLLAIPFVKVGGAAVTNPIFTPTGLGESSTGIS